MKTAFFRKTSLFVFFIHLISFCQDYKGKVIDTKGNAIAYANIVVKNINSDSFILGTSTDSNGNFTFSKKNNDPLYIEISFLGFAKQRVNPTTTNLGIITLKENTLDLQEITIQGRKKILRKEFDKLILDVEKSSFHKGYSALEILQRAPQTYLSPEGNIMYQNKNVTVIIDNRKVNMIGKELSDYLEGINSERIKNISFQKMGAANSDASDNGGIITINLKRISTGFESSIRGESKFRGNGKWGQLAGVNANFGSKKWNIYSQLNYRESNNLYKYNSTTTFFDTSYKNSNYGSADNSGKKYSATIGAVFYPNKKHIFGGEFYINNFNRKLNIYETLETYQPKLRDVADNISITNYNKNLWYSSLNNTFKTDSIGSKISTLLEIGNTIIENKNDVDTEYTQGLNSINRNQFTSNANSIYYNTKLDWLKKLSKSSLLESGVKALIVNRDNTLDVLFLKNSNWLPINDQKQDFINSEYIYAGYTSLSSTINKKHQIKIGLRAEFTKQKGEDNIAKSKFSKTYTDWFPNFYYGYKLPRNKNISFSYARKIRRPKFKNLNPFVRKQNDFLYIIGNPNLKPQYTNKFKTSFSSKNHRISLYGNFTKNLIFNAYSVKDGISYNSPQNFGNENSIGIHHSFNKKIHDWLNIRITSGIYSYNFEKELIKTDKIAFYNIINTRFTLSETFNCNISNVYFSKKQFRTVETSESTRCNVTFEKRFSKGNARIKLLFEDVFNSLRDKNISTYENFDFDFYQKGRSRAISLSLVYSFKNKTKFTTKKNKTSNDSRKRL